MQITTQAHDNAQALLNFIDASPSPWHAVAVMEEHLRSHDFQPLQETERWALQAGGRYYVVRGGSSLIAFVIGQRPLAETGYRIVGAHTDSPGFRLKPKAPHAAETMMRLGVEVYGGPILATFADRDLSLAGRVHLRGGTIESRLIHFDRPLVRIPNLAIHMNRNVNEDGLKLNKQTEIPLLFGNLDETAPRERFAALLAERAGVPAADILSWELAVCDTQKGAFWGADGEFIADSQLDNLASCHAGLTALLGVQQPEPTCVCALFDHEEVGSESAKGAGGSFLADVLARVEAMPGIDADDRFQARARSFFVSADMAHAYQPNFPSAYEPTHRILVNGGPVIKTNANQRYATDAASEARFMALCDRAGVPYQQYAHRTDLGCGSTIGPMIAAGLGMATVDVGCPMWAMHSARESAGVLDQHHMTAVLRLFFGGEAGAPAA